MNLILPKDYMNNLTTTTNNKTAPLTNERKPAPVLDTPENIEGVDRAGWFDENPIEKGFDATTGSINNFNPDKVVSDSVVSEIFGGSDQWISIKPLDIANKAATTISNTAGVIGKVASAGKDAFADLLDQVTVTPESQTPPDPKKQEELKEQAEYMENRQQGEDTEAKILAIHRQIEQMAQLEEKRENIARLAGMNESFELVISGSGKIRTDLEPIIERKSEELRRTKEQQVQASLDSPAKHGSRGPKMSMDDNKSGETHATAQTATG